MVSFIGRKVDQEKWEYFNQADIFCFPSLYDCETFGNMVVEAMMFQLPSWPHGGEAHRMWSITV